MGAHDTWENTVTTLPDIKIGICLPYLQVNNLCVTDSWMPAECMRFLSQRQNTTTDDRANSMSIGMFPCPLSHTRTVQRSQNDATHGIGFVIGEEN